jgi:hypothetical protein
MTGWFGAKVAATAAVVAVVAAVGIAASISITNQPTHVSQRDTNETPLGSATPTTESRIAVATVTGGGITTTLGFERRTDTWSLFYTDSVAEDATPRAFAGQLYSEIVFEESLIGRSLPNCAGGTFGVVRDPRATSVEVRVGDDAPFQVPLIEPPARVNFDGRLWIAYVPRIDHTVVNLLEADGNVLRTDGWYANPPDFHWPTCSNHLLESYVHPTPSGNPSVVPVASVVADDRAIVLAISPWGPYMRDYVYDAEEPTRRSAGFKAIGTPQAVGYTGDESYPVQWGAVDDSVATVELVFATGEPMRVEPVAAPPEAGTGLRYWIASTADRGVLLEVRLLTADGAVIDTRLMSSAGGRD